MNKAGKPRLASLGGKPIQLQQANRMRPMARSAPHVNDVDWQRRVAVLLKKTRRERMRSYSLGTENRHVKEKNRELVKSNQALKLENGRLIKELQESKAIHYELSLTINELQKENLLLSEVVAKNDGDLSEAMSNLVKTSQFITSSKETINKFRKCKENFKRWTSCDLQNVGAEQRYLNRAENLQTRTVNPMVQGMPLLQPKIHIQPVVMPQGVIEFAPDQRQNMSPVTEEDPVGGDMEEQTEQSRGSNEEHIASAESSTGAQRYFTDESSMTQREHLSRTPEKGRFSYGERSRLFSSHLSQIESRNEMPVRADYDPMEGSSWMHQDNNSGVPKRRMRMSNLGRRENKRQFVMPSLSTSGVPQLATSCINEAQDLSDATYFNSSGVDLAQSEVPSKASNKRLATSPSDSTIYNISNVSLSNGLGDDQGSRIQNPFVKMSFLESVGAASFKEISDAYCAEKYDLHMAEDESQSSSVSCIPNSVTIRHNYSMSAQKSLEYREMKSFPESTSLSDESESPVTSELQPLIIQNYLKSTNDFGESAVLSSRIIPLVIEQLPEVKIIMEKLPSTLLPVETVSSENDSSACQNVIQNIEDTSAAVAFVELSDAVINVSKQALTRVTTRARSKTTRDSAAQKKRTSAGEVSTVCMQSKQLKRSKKSVGDKIKRLSDRFKPCTIAKQRTGQKQLKRRSSTHSRSSSKSRSSESSQHTKTGRNSIAVDESPPQPRFNVGFHAVCNGCGQLSVDFNRCRQCQKKLPPDVASVPVGDAQLNQFAVICDDSLRLTQSSETSCKDNESSNHSQAPLTVVTGAIAKNLRSRRKATLRNLAEPTLKRKLRR